MKEIQLTQGKVTLIDDEDYKVLSNYNWCYHKKDGAVTRNLGTIIKLHRVIIKTPKGMEVDHINGNKLDNRKENLRICTHSENMKNTKIKRVNNTSGYKGVSKHRNKWVTMISNTLGDTEYVGIFQNKIDAAHAYDIEAKKRFGKFARLNFTEE